jgi:hypothetical protein
MKFDLMIISPFILLFISDGRIANVAEIFFLNLTCSCTNNINELFSRNRDEVLITLLILKVITFQSIIGYVLNVNIIVSFW